MALDDAEPTAAAPPSLAATAALFIEEARLAGLLDGGSTHLSVRVPSALLEAAMRETGLTSKAELSVAALSGFASPDPFVAFMKQTRGALGKDHRLEY